MAAEGSPWWLDVPILSISSNKNTGLETPTFLRPLTIKPGIAATYVRRCPRISASSRTPPREILWNFRPSAVATDLAKLVFPTPGGPTRSKIGDLFLVRPLSVLRLVRSIGLFIDLVNLRLEVGVHLLLELEVELIFGKSCPRNLGKILKLSFGDFGGLWRQLSIVDTLFQLINLVGLFFIVSNCCRRIRAA
ncbi:hypothetical protein KCU92_g200, partial [Aureobasidium melanogenum]